MPRALLAKKKKNKKKKEKNIQTHLSKDTKLFS